MMEEWQQAIIRMEEHTKNIKDELTYVATKECVEQEGEKTRAAIPKDNGFKEKLIMWLLIALFAALGLTGMIKYLVNGGG
jgi:hypothetical protein